MQMIGGGFLHGSIKVAGRLSGDDWSFIYPDMETAFRGQAWILLIMQFRS
jgi:hypothetical protein